MVRERERERKRPPRARALAHPLPNFSRHRRPNTNIKQGLDRASAALTMFEKGGLTAGAGVALARQ